MKATFFLESKIYKSKGKIIIKVEENPVISDIKFEGNKKVDSEILLSEMSLGKRSVYTRSKLASDVNRVNNIYIKSGRFLSRIDPRIVTKENNRIDLIFKIYEGKKAKVNNINFIGNSAFFDKRLKEEITTKENKWYKFFSGSSDYDSDRVEFDKEKLRRFYHERGYIDFSVISAIAQISPGKDKFSINFLLEEGSKYKFGDLRVVSDIDKFDKSVLEKAITSKKGSVYNGSKVTKILTKMVSIMSEHGYAFVEIDPVLKKDKQTKVASVDYVINKTLGSTLMQSRYLVITSP